MSDRSDFYYLELVTDQEVNGAFDGMEAADRNQNIDAALIGAMSGLGVAQHGAGDGTVNIGIGAGYDKLGERLLVPSTQNINVSVDSSNVSTDVAAIGNHRIVSVFLLFDRALSDPRIDGNSNTVYFVRAESFKTLVVQGAEAPSPTPPSLQASGILLADITRDYGVSAIMQDHISTSRREDAFVANNTPRSIRAGTALGGLTQMLQFYCDHVNGVADQHTATALSYSGSGPWADGSTVPSGTVEATFDAVVSDLASTSSGHSGARLIGIEAITGTFGTIAAGELYAVVNALHLATNHDYGGGPTWADSTTNPAASVEAQLDKIVNDLAAASSGYTGNSGAHKVGSDALASVAGVSGTVITGGTLYSVLQLLKNASYLDVGARNAWLDGTGNPAQSVYAAINSIYSALASNATGADGMAKIGAAARSAWLGGRTNIATDAHSALNKIITDLAAQGAADDGATRIGAAAQSGSPYALSAGSVSSQLATLLADVNALSAADAAFATTAALASQVASTGETLIGGRALTGTGFNLPAGTVEARHQAIINAAAPIASPTFTGTVTAPTFAGTFSGRRYRAHANLTASGTLNFAFFVDIASANEFFCNSGNPNSNYIKIREGTSTLTGGLQDGDWIQFTTGAGLASGHAYTIFRENGTTQLAELWGPGQWVRFSWDAANTKWRYAGSSVWVPNGTSFPSPDPYYGDGLSTTGTVLYPANL